MKQLRQDMSKVSITKRVLFVCEQNNAVGVMAESVFNHMGPNMARGWVADSAGIKVRFEGSPIDNRASQIMKLYAVPETGKNTKKFKPSHLNEFGTILCSDFEIVKQVKLQQEEGCSCTVLMLGDYHKRGSIEIKDPALSKDIKAWDKCYWLVYYGVQGFLKKIKEDVAEVKKEKVIKKRPVKKAKPKILDTQIPKSKSCPSNKIIDVFIPCPDLVLLDIAIDLLALQLDKILLSPPQDTDIEITDNANPKPKWKKIIDDLNIYQEVLFIPLATPPHTPPTLLLHQALPSLDIDIPDKTNKKTQFRKRINEPEISCRVMYIPPTIASCMDKVPKVTQHMQVFPEEQFLEDKAYIKCKALNKIFLQEIGDVTIGKKTTFPHHPFVKIPDIAYYCLRNPPLCLLEPPVLVQDLKDCINLVSNKIRQPLEDSLPKTITVIYPTFPAQTPTQVLICSDFPEPPELPNAYPVRKADLFDQVKAVRTIRKWYLEDTINYSQAIKLEKFFSDDSEYQNPSMLFIPAHSAIEFKPREVFEFVNNTNDLCDTVEDSIIYSETIRFLNFPPNIHQPCFMHCEGIPELLLTSPNYSLDPPQLPKDYPNVDDTLNFQPRTLSKVFNLSPSPGIILYHALPSLNIMSTARATVYKEAIPSPDLPTVKIKYQDLFDQVRSYRYRRYQ